VEALIGFLMRANPVPAGSVLLTGTGIVIGEEAALEAGDSVTIRAEQIGELTNRAVLVS
jgi:2-keto-4-pentenoate hydratase/2-oxohepta-3-ene-1,7-dioic acid hydratase in catechol pathway